MKLLKWKWKHNKSWHWNWFSDAAGSDPRLLQPPEGMIISSGSETDHWKLLVLHWFNMRLVPHSVPRAERATVRLNQSFVSLETSLSILPFILSLLNSMAWGALAGGTNYGSFSWQRDGQGYRVYKTTGLVSWRLLWICGMLCQEMIQDIFLHHSSF